MLTKFCRMFLISVSNGMFHLTPIKMCHLNVCFAGICIICYVNMFLPLRRQGVSFYCLGFLTSMYYGFAAFKVQLLLLWKLPYVYKTSNCQIYNNLCWSCAMSFPWCVKLTRDDVHKQICVLAWTAPDITYVSGSSDTTKLHFPQRVFEIFCKGFLS